MLNYSDKFIELKNRNIEEVIIEASNNTPSKWLLEKVNKFCTENEFINSAELLEQIKSNKVVAAFFAKDPKKQNFYEKVALDYLKDMFSIIKLPASGSKAIFISKGTISNNKNLGSKSIDFLIEYNNNKYYISHKYINEAGGAQDHQFNDLLDFIDNSNYATNNYYLAIGDGGYFIKNKIDTINKYIKSDRVFFCNINEVENVIKTTTRSI